MMVVYKQLIQQQAQINQQKKQNISGNMDSEKNIIDSIKDESKCILLVIILSLVLNLEQVDSLLKYQPTLFVNESGSINLQGILLKSLVIGILYYIIKFYLF